MENGRAAKRLFRLRKHRTLCFSDLVPRCAVHEVARALPLDSHCTGQVTALPCGLGTVASAWIDARHRDYAATVTLAHRANHQVPAGNSTSGLPLRHASYARR
jgi:hypothetical protein